MIKNLLYSLFLHSLLFLVIYLNFNLHKIDENKTQEVVVSLVTLNGEDKANNAQPVASNAKEEVKKEEEKKEVEETKVAESPKVSEKNKVKKAPKKLAKAKAAKAIKKPVQQEKVEEFKPEEKEEVKQEDAKKPQEDVTKNQNEDAEQNEVAKKEEDLGAKKEAEKETEEKKQESPKEVNISDMSNSLENIDLSSREKFNIQSQLKFCYRMAIKETKLEGKIKIIAKVNISRDGKMSTNVEELIDKTRFDNPAETDYRNSITNVQRALDLCSPLRNLPLDKYDIWKEVVLEFEE